MATPAFDHGPRAALARHFVEVPAPPEKDDFWFDWGPVFYRGRLDGSARVLCLASDPGPTERIAGRSLVGNAGQRVQGMLAKLGLTRSYVCLNAWAYAVHPSRSFAERDRLDEPAQRGWRNGLYDEATGPGLEAIIAFGEMAQEALDQWWARPDVALCEVPHPPSPQSNLRLYGETTQVAEAGAPGRPRGGLAAEREHKLAGGDQGRAPLPGGAGPRTDTEAAG